MNIEHQVLRSLKTIQSKENSFQVPRHCKTKKHLKKGRKTTKFAHDGQPCAPVQEAVLATVSCALVHAPCVWCAGKEC